MGVYSNKRSIVFQGIDDMYSRDVQYRTNDKCY